MRGVSKNAAQAQRNANRRAITTDKQHKALSKTRLTTTKDAQEQAQSTEKAEEAEAMEQHQARGEAKKREELDAMNIMRSTSISKKGHTLSRCIPLANLGMENDASVNWFKRSEATTKLMRCDVIYRKSGDVTWRMTKGLKVGLQIGANPVVAD
ncbi:hypothetical protein PsorP6_013294 [Peronosclerospora sorghi]|uniref:Uncharacterized protein n=1 Tax=Peronosclerospora sorghi TaxID=230839 RepID=A0ACC0WGQ2_9STRA|nr:hypothetical protein PsorP6_013294 [Peronosclerospora sorghi]